MQYDNKNRGAAFRKDNANPKAPKFAGPLNVDGKDYEVSIWEKTSKNGDYFLSLSVKEPFKKDSHNKSKSNGYAPKDRDEEIPF
jgi:uncharacterized protein (DUF736 family)